ncbi:hypothetical protein BVX97_02565 [bacterium E08(2017)]|nr:hypothetical protein BVX97_02565 [bacterium E08(2017)]
MIKYKARSIIICLLIVAGLAFAVRADYPQWWQARGVIDQAATTNDYAPAVMGQLKWMASNAQDELEANLEGGAGTAIPSVLGTWLPDGVDHAPVLIGQAKYISSLFYDRLIAEGVFTQYPWSADIGDDMDFAPANIGQIKYLFNFNLTGDLDSDGIPDWWETRHGVDDPLADPDGDGLDNETEFLVGENPNVAYQPEASGTGQGEGLVELTVLTPME